MSNPLIIPSSPSTFPLGPAESTDNLTALGSGHALGLGSVGTAGTQYYDDNVGPIQVKTGSGASGTGTINLYLILSEDGSHWTDGIDPTSSSDQSAKINFARQLAVISDALASTIYTFDEFSVYTSLNMGYMPSFWAILIWNQSGGALDATAGNFRAQHNLISYA